MKVHRSQRSLTDYYYPKFATSGVSTLKPRLLLFATITSRVLGQRALTMPDQASGFAPTTPTPRPRRVPHAQINSALLMSQSPLGFRGFGLALGALDCGRPGPFRAWGRKGTRLICSLRVMRGRSSSACHSQLVHTSSTLSQPSQTPVNCLPSFSFSTSPSAFSLADGFSSFLSAFHSDLQLSP
jgi:hypothetical protein